MKNNNSPKKDPTTVSFLFGEFALASSLKDRLGFKETLQEQVLQYYLEYSSNESALKRQNKIIKYLRFFAVSLFALLISVFSLGFYGLNRNTKVNANLSFAEGSVLYKDSVGNWIEVEEDQQLDNGDSIKINGVGKAIIDIDDGSSIRLASDSAVTIENLSTENIRIANDKGEVYTRVAKADRKFEVVIDGIYIESLGTAFKTVNNTNKKGVEVYQSKVQVKGLTKELDIIVDEGNQYFMLNSDIPEKEKQVVAVTTEQIVADEFVVWNKEKDIEKNIETESLGILQDVPTNNNVEVATDNTIETPISLPEDEVNIEGSTAAIVEPEMEPDLLIKGNSDSEGIFIIWEAINLDISKGINIVYSNTNTSPSIEDSTVKEILDISVNEFKFNIKDGNDYHFRLCRITESGCDFYTNTLTIQAPEGEVSVVLPANNKIELRFEDNAIKWNVVGNATGKFLAVWSKKDNPSVPSIFETRTINIDLSSENFLSQLNPFNGSGGYFLRICEETILNTCGMYSNEIIVYL